MTSITQYQLYCFTDGSITGYGDQPPTTCYIDTSHEINHDSVIELKTITSQSMITTDSSPPNSQFQLTTIPFTIPAFTGPNPNINILTKVFPFDMYLWELNITQHPLSIGDTLDICVGPDTIIGYINQPCLSGTNKIHVSPTVITNVLRGSEISISPQKGSSEYPGLITMVDEKNFTITVENNLNDFYPIGSLIKISTYPVRNFIFDGGDRMVVGRKGLTAKLIPANIPITVTYTDNTNNSNDAIQIYLQLSYYFK